MEAIFRNGFDGFASYNAFCDNPYEAGPIAYRINPDAPNFYEIYQNPVWVADRPQIITFQDYLQWYEPIDYKATLNWLFFRKEIGAGKQNPFPRSDIDYTATKVTHHRTYLTRIDETTFCHDEIVIANIHAHCCYNSYELTEWYRFRTIRTVGNDLQGELQVMIYDPADAVHGLTMLDSLAPDLGYINSVWEDVATEALAKYYDKALRTGCRVNAYEFADNMGYAVKEVFISPDQRCGAKVVYEGMDITLYDMDKGEMKRQTIKERTVLVDPAANKGKHYDSTEDSIIHECIHIFLHQPWYKLQMLHNERLECAGLDCDLETLILENSEREDLHVIERQARGMTPRVRMPVGSFKMHELQFQQENDRRFFNHGRAVEKTTAQLAVYYGTSKECTRNRQKELGNTEVNGVLVYCNGRYLPRHSWSTELRYNESYSIESSVLNDLRENDPVLNVILSHELFVYVDGFVCLNRPDYVSFGKWGRKLTPKALKDVSVCCLKFTIHNEHEDNEFTYGVLNNIDKRKMVSAEISQSSIDEVYQRALTKHELPLKIYDEFLFIVKKNMEIVGLTEGQFQEMAMIEENRFHKILSGKIKGVTVGEVVAMGLSLGMTPEEIIDLVDKSPAKWERCLYHDIIKVFIHEYYRETVHAFNKALIKCNQLPLVDEELAFKRKPSKPSKTQVVVVDTAMCTARP